MSCSASPSRHPCKKMLQAFGNGQLDAATAEAVGKHIDECEDCLIKVASITSDGILDAMRGAWSVCTNESGTTASTGFNHSKPRSRNLHATKASLPQQPN